MIEESEVTHIREFIEEFLQKMTIADARVQAVVGVALATDTKDVVDVAIIVEEPQILIGQNGQTLFELGRLLRIMLNKKLKKDFYVNIDINDYKKKKVEYLENLAASYADQAVKDGGEKILPPMPAYEEG